MWDQFKKTLDNLSDTIRDQAGSVSDAARDRSMKMIEEWLTVFPRLQAYGMEVTSFAVNLALSPGLDVEMCAAREEFSPAKVRAMLAENKEAKWMVFVLKTVIMAYEMDEKLDRREPYDKVILKIRVRVPPEVRVVLGEPILY